MRSLSNAQPEREDAAMPKFSLDDPPPQASRVAAANSFGRSTAQRAHLALQLTNPMPSAYTVQPANTIQPPTQTSSFAFVNVRQEPRIGMTRAAGMADVTRARSLERNSAPSGARTARTPQERSGLMVHQSRAQYYKSLGHNRSSPKLTAVGHIGGGPPLMRGIEAERQQVEPVVVVQPQMAEQAILGNLRQETMTSGWAHPVNRHYSPQQTGVPAANVEIDSRFGRFPEHDLGPTYV